MIGKNCIITAHSFFGGSANIGDNVWIAPCVCIRDGGISIGPNAFIGMASVVTKDVPEGTAVMGFPAAPVEKYKKYLRTLKSFD